jgi:outer membrane protein OmpA-like peptidoglycan-associated protein
MMKQFFMTVVALLVLGGVASAQQQSKSDETVEFRPHWGVKVQGGGAYTLGESSFADLLSPAAQVSATYNFHPFMGVRFGLSGWQGKGNLVVVDETYKFRFAQLHADFVLDLANLIGGFKHDRVWTPYVFAGLAGAYGFDNYAVGEYIPDYKAALGGYWNTRPFFAVRAGAGMDFWVAKNVALGLEVNADGYGEAFNSKLSTPKANPDYNFHALLGVKVRFGGNTRPSKAYADKVAAEEAAAAAEAARLAAEKAEAERLAAEKAEAERIAREKAEAERLAAEKAAAEAAAAAQRAALAAEHSDNIFFTIGSFYIRKVEDAKLVKLAEFMKEHTDFNVAIVGYADKATGSPAVNMAISKKRADVVVKRLVALGVEEGRISVDCKGDTEQPFEKNDMNRVIICTLQ